MKTSAWHACSTHKRSQLHHVCLGPSPDAHSSSTLPIHLSTSPFFSFISPLPWRAKIKKKEKKKTEREQGSGFGSDQTQHVCALCVRTSRSVCEEQLKSNSSEQVFSSNDLSLLSISLLTTSCRGRDRQGQTQPRQREREGSDRRKENKEENFKRKSQPEGEETIKHEEGMQGKKKHAESPCSY